MCHCPPGWHLAEHCNAIGGRMTEPERPDPVHDPDWPSITPADESLPVPPDHDEPASEDGGG